MQMIAYLGFDGTCEEAFRFYEKVLGARIHALIRYGEMPGAPGACADGDKTRVAHVLLQAGEAFLMGGDRPASMGNAPKMQGFSVSLSVESAAEAERIFATLSQSGDVGMPMAETFWAHRFGMCVDRFGTPWMVGFNKAA